jgi:hypothetical protein
MSCGRILIVALCLCTPLALAQDDSLITGKAANNVQQGPDFRIPPSATPSEPWRILPKPDNNVQQGPDLRIPPSAAPSEPWRILPKPDWDKGRVVMTPETGPEGIIVSPDGPLAAGTTCYAIRSYVVAPDAKGTDSVHPDGYSTCIPAANFRLKTPDDYLAR